MSQFKSVLKQIGGANAISIWTWLITLPLSLAVSNVAVASPAKAFNPLHWLLTLIALHLILGLFLWISHAATLQWRKTVPRPLIMLGIFAILGGLRAVALSLIDPILGPETSSADSRTFTNLVGGTLAVTLIAVLVDDYRSHKESSLQLLRAKFSLEWLTKHESETIQAADVEEIAKVRQEVQNQLRLGLIGADHIRSISDSIVRTRSHYLADTSQIQIVGALPETRSRRASAEGALLGFDWPNPLVLAMLVQLIVFSSVAITWGVAVAVANAALAGLLIFALAALAKKFVRLPTPALLRVLIVGSFLLLMALIASSVVSVLISYVLTPFPPNYLVAVTLIVLTGIGLSLRRSVNRDRHQRRQELMQAVADEAEAVERIHGEVSRRRAAASDFLHGPIQSQLVASAMRGESNEQVLAAVEKQFDQYSLNSETWNVKEQILDLVGGWSDVVDLNLSCSEATFTKLQGKPLSSRLLVDALSEAITNVVRHGKEGQIAIAIDPVPGGPKIRLEVASYGELSPGSASGTGLARLRDRGAQIELVQIGERVIMTALV